MKLVPAAEPEWLVIVPARGDDPAVEVLAAPARRAAITRAWGAYTAAVQAEGDSLDASDAFCISIVHARVKDWRGVGDAEGAPLPLSPDALTLALEDETFGSQLLIALADPVFARELEKNVSSAAPAGTSQGSTDTKAK